MQSAELDRLLRIFASLVPPLVAGCGPAAIDTARFSDNLCDSGLEVLDAVEVDGPLDYLELRQYSPTLFDDAGEPTEWSETTILDSSGQRCAGASDPAACAAAFDALPRKSSIVQFDGGFDGNGSHRSLAFTSGDEVGVAASIGEVQALLGAIDAPGDAALLAIVNGHTLVCDEENDVAQESEGFVVHTRSGGGCGSGDDVEEHIILVRPDGSIEVIQTVLIEKGDPNCAIGRMPAGLRRPREPSNAAHPVGAFLADVAHLEAASVTAFEQLACELALHRAPTAMIRAALRSRRDEIHHARATASLARRYGGRPIAPRIDRFAARSLLEVAADNATEGCIRETYGALVAHVQARRARDRSIRRVLTRIAHDETRHAALSWSLARWAASRMHPAARRRVARKTDDALQRLEIELTRAYADDVHTITGLPRPDEARALYRRLRDAVFGGRRHRGIIAHGVA